MTATVIFIFFGFQQFVRVIFTCVLLSIQCLFEIEDVCAVVMSVLMGILDVIFATLLVLPGGLASLKLIDEGTSHNELDKPSKCLVHRIIASGIRISCQLGNFSVHSDVCLLEASENHISDFL